MKKLLLLAIAVIGLSSFAPAGSFQMRGKKVTFRLDNPDLTTVILKVIDSEGRIVYFETTKEEQLNKVFNFEKAFSDDYTIIVKDGPETYKRAISVD